MSSNTTWVLGALMAQNPTSQAAGFFFLGAASCQRSGFHTPMGKVMGVQVDVPIELAEALAAGSSSSTAAFIVAASLATLLILTPSC